MVHLGLVVLQVLVCIAACTATDEWTAAEYPNPQTHPESCGRGSVKSSVCDPNGVIFSEDGEHFSQFYLILLYTSRLPGFARVPISSTTYYAPTQ